MSKKHDDMENYRQQLDATASARYIQKLQLVNGLDPYSIPRSDMSSNPQDLPAIRYPDLVNYCVFTRSAYTMDEFKSYKSLEAYNQFVCGWVSDVRAYSVNCESKTRVIVRAKVNHSQALSQAPLQPWVIAENSGEVLAAHCNCMAGLGETCTHVSAVLFAVDAAVSLEQSKTVTQTAAYWMLPSGVSKVEMAQIKDINFKSAANMKRKLDNSIAQRPMQESKPQALPDVPIPTEEELADLYKEMFETNVKPAVLSLVPSYSKYYKPQVLQTPYPWMALDFKHKLFGKMAIEEVKVQCEELCSSSCFHVSEAARNKLEEKTRGQASTRLWQRFRAGRITASNMKKVCQTKIEQPAVSTIKLVCYPQDSKVDNSATRWGCQHEKVALASYEKFLSANHESVTVKACGLVLHKNYSFVGASPDSVTNCVCCGNGVVEVKCPYSIKDKHIEEGISNKDFALQHDCEYNVETRSVIIPHDKQSGSFTSPTGPPTSTTLRLKENHPHYYQLQTQMMVCESTFGDYVMWTECEIFIQRILPDVTLWNQMLDKCKSFFEVCVLPEVVGGIFSRPQPAPLTEHDSSQTAATSVQVLTEANNTSSSENVENRTDDTETEELFCFCQTPYNEDFNYIGCDNMQNCQFKWFHYECVGITEAPEGDWFCPVCDSKSKGSTSKQSKRARKN